jgi:hypothetical protein
VPGIRPQNGHMPGAALAVAAAPNFGRQLGLGLELAERGDGAPCLRATSRGISSCSNCGLTRSRSATTACSQRPRNRPSRNAPTAARHSKRVAPDARERHMSRGQSRSRSRLRLDSGRPRSKLGHQPGEVRRPGRMAGRLRSLLTWNRNRSPWPPQ